MKTNDKNSKKESSAARAMMSVPGGAVRMVTEQGRPSKEWPRAWHLH